MKKLNYFSAIKAGYINCFNYRGRATRIEFYSMFSLYLLTAPIFVFAIGSGYSIVFHILFACVLIPLFSVIIRRMHDTGISGFWGMFTFVPYVGLPALLIYSIRDSEPGANKWGPNPKGIVEREDVI